MRRTALSVLLPILVVACSGSSSTATPSQSPTNDEVVALVAEAYDSFDTGELDEGMVTVNELVSRFGESSDPTVAPIVARALYNSGTAFYQAGRFEGALAPYEDLAVLFADSTDPEVLSDVADGLFNQGLAFHELGRHEEELASFEEIDTFRESTDPYIASLVGRALNNKGIALHELNRSLEEQLAAFEEVISRYGDSSDPIMLPNVARAFFSKGFALHQMGRIEEAVTAYSTVISRYEASADVTISEFVVAAKQQLNKIEPNGDVEPLLFELRIRDSYWDSVSDDEIRTKAETICAVANESSSATELWMVLEEKFGEEEPQRIGELAAILQYVAYCDPAANQILAESFNP